MREMKNETESMNTRKMIGRLWRERVSGPWSPNLQPQAYKRQIIVKF